MHINYETEAELDDEQDAPILHLPSVVWRNLTGEHRFLFVQQVQRESGPAYRCRVSGYGVRTRNFYAHTWEQISCECRLFSWAMWATWRITVCNLDHLPPLCIPQRFGQLDMFTPTDPSRSASAFHGVGNPTGPSGEVHRQPRVVAGQGVAL